MKIKMAKGITANMGNFNSFRVDFEIEKEINEADYEKELENLSREIHKVLDREVTNVRLDNANSK